MMPVAHVQVDFPDRRRIEAGDARHIGGQTLPAIPRITVNDFIAFDEVVDQQARGDVLCVEASRGPLIRY
jgi:hypothetical protein